MGICHCVVPAGVFLSPPHFHSFQFQINRLRFSPQHIKYENILTIITCFKCTGTKLWNYQNDEMFMILNLSRGKKNIFPKHCWMMNSKVLKVSVEVFLREAGKVGLKVNEGITKYIDLRHVWTTPMLWKLVF